MRKPFLLANAMLWVAAIVASAVLAAPTFLTLMLLPLLGSSSRLMGWQGGRLQRSDLS